LRKQQLEHTMAVDIWVDQEQGDNWDTPSDWSAGLPGPSSSVVIKYTQSTPQVTASFGTVASISIPNILAALTFIDAGASSVAGAVTNSGGFYLDPSSGDGGSSLTIGRKLTNSQAIQIGPSDNTLSAPSTIQAASLSDMFGGISLNGSATAEASLDVGSTAGFGAAGDLEGDIYLSGAALIEFKGGQIANINQGSGLTLIGSHAFVADASNTASNSALAGLRTLGGPLDLESGAAVTTSSGLANGGAITLDGESGDGGSLLDVKGTLTNGRTISIGPSDNTLSAESTLEAAKVGNDGTIDLTGSKGVNATLTCAGSFTNDGAVNLVHDSETIAGAVSGTGDFSLSTSTLEFAHGVSNGETVTFASPAGYADHLILGSPSSFAGTIDDFATAGDSVTAKGFAEAQTMLTYTQIGADSCSWTLTQGAQTAVLNFAGAAYAQSDFSISSSANGAVLIKHV
jgi:hypothetical protein